MGTGWPVAPASAATEAAEALEPATATSGTLVARLLASSRLVAIWSAPLADVQAFPARFLARFLHNHGMLQVDGRPQWRTVVGGSRSYVAPLCAPFRDRIRLRTPVRTIVRSSLGVASFRWGSRCWTAVG